MLCHWLFHHKPNLPALVILRMPSCVMSWMLWPSLGRRLLPQRSSLACPHTVKKCHMRTSNHTADGFFLLWWSCCQLQEWARLRVSVFTSKLHLSSPKVEMLDVCSYNLSCFSSFNVLNFKALAWFLPRYNFNREMTALQSHFLFILLVNIKLSQLLSFATWPRKSSCLDLASFWTFWP